MLVGLNRIELKTEFLPNSAPDKEQYLLNGSIAIFIYLKLAGR